MPTFIFIGWTILLSFLPYPAETPEVYLLVKGSLSFRSEAPLELIQASSQELKGALDISKNTFAFTVKMNSFSGFNSTLQREHFCEKFMDCEQHPSASFRGKLIESIDFSQAGTHEVRAKGKLVVHGIERERIIRGTLEIGPGGIVIDSQFTVPLEDHDIAIPKVVNQNIAEVIEVQIHAELFPQ